MKLDRSKEDNLYSRIENLLVAAREKVVMQVNQAMIFTYFEIGKIIVESEQEGEERAPYGKGLLKNISSRLSEVFGRGFSVDNLENMRKFYLTYAKSETLSRKSKLVRFQLSWSHYLKLMRMDDENERNFYEIEAIENQWSLRELQRQSDSANRKRTSNTSYPSSLLSSAIG